MNVAIDIGRQFTKYQSFDVQGYLPSIVSAAIPDKAGDDIVSGCVDDIDNSDPITFNGRSFIIGSGVRDIIGPQMGVIEWINSYQWLALIYCALANVRANGATYLALSVCDEVYLGIKQKLIDRLGGYHTFNTNGRQYRVDINPVIIPQSAATALYYMNQNIGLTQVKFAIINLGYSHTSYTVLNNGVIDEGSTGSCDVGIRTLFDAVEETIKRDFEQSLTYHEIRSVITHKTINIKGQNFYLEHNINTTIQRLVLRLFNEIEATWQNNPGINIIITGGGAVYFAEHIKKLIPGVKVARNGFKAASKGMLNYLEQINPDNPDQKLNNELTNFRNTILRMNFNEQ